MTEVTQDTDSVRKTAPEAVEVQVGHQLENARVHLQISLSEMALRLRLGEKQVLALETGNLAALPGKTFVRGFVRNYARAVQIDPIPLLSLLDSVDKLSAPKLDLPESTHVAMPDQGRGINRDLLTVIAGLALVAIAAALYFFLPDQLFQSQKSPHVDNGQSMSKQTDLLPENRDNPPEDTRPETEIPAQTDTPAANEINPAAAAPAAPPAQPATNTPSAPATITPVPVTAPTTGNGRIHLSFSNDSWVEVRDGAGKTLSSGQHPAGTQHEVDGTPPLTVIVGRASGVELRYQGKPVPLRPNADSDIARVVLP